MIINHNKFLYNKFVKTTAIDAFYYLAVNLYVPFLAPYLSELGWSEPLKGLFFALFGIVGIFASPIVGSLSDRIGRFKMMMFGMILEVIALTGLIHLTNPVLLMIVRVIGAIAFNSVIISAFARINDTIETDKARSKGNGIFKSITSVAMIFSPIIGGVIADYYTYLDMFKVAQSFMIVILLGIVMYDIFYYDEKKATKSQRKKSTKGHGFNIIKNTKEVMAFKELRSLSLLGFATHFSIPIKHMVLPIIILSTFELSNTHLSIALLVMNGALVLEFILGNLSDRIGKGKSVIIGQLVNVGGLVALFFAPNFVWLIIILLLRSFGRAFWDVSALSFMSDIGERHDVEGNVFGSYISMGRIASSLSFLVSGFLLTFLNSGIFLVYAGLILIGLIFTGKIIWRTKTESSNT